MKKLSRTTFLVVILALMITLTSCLRDVDTPPTVDRTNTSETDIFTDMSAQTESMSTETEYVPPDVQLSEEAMMWTDKHPEADTVIMTPEQIESDNLRMLGESASLTDITNVTNNYTGAELIAQIGDDRKPTLPAYDHDGTEITYEHYNTVIANMGLDSIAEDNPVKLGIVVSRANLRCIPDDKPYLGSPDSLYDMVQQTELHVGVPVWVLHQSVDGEYFYVKSPSYAGWVKSCDIAITDNSDAWSEFATPKSFVVVTETSVFINESELDMGVKLPMVAYDNGIYTVKLPEMDENGVLTYTETDIPAHYVSEGYLPYTYRNFVTQAFKYEGVMYSWGGLDSGVDCSSFVSNVMRTFGFVLPRDTKDQESVVGATIDVIGKSHSEVAAIIEDITAPTAVYYKGHVLFYLGHNGAGEYSFIHAPQIGEAVSIERKRDLSGLRYICPFAKSE